MKVSYGKGFFEQSASAAEGRHIEAATAMGDLMLSMSGSTKDKIEGLARSLMQYPQVDCPVRHYFAPGQYAREITIPAGTALFGAVHKTDNLVVLSKGTLRIVTSEGPVEISAPTTMLCKAGTRNAAVAITDVVWTNFFPTDETDPDKLVELLTEAKADEIMGGSKNEQMLMNASLKSGELLCQ